jgi:tRNA modification GTPase
MLGDTIFALSSGQLPAGVAVVRISGTAAQAALEALLRHTALPLARRASLRTVYHPKSNDILDTALVLWFPGSKTATGEPLAELHLHGGRAVVAAVLAVLGDLPGLRVAQAGEFTRRAFENGRIDLAQAEGLADLLSAETEGQRRHALQLATGHFSQHIKLWQTGLLRLSAQIEAAIDFSDEDDVPDGVIADVQKAIAALRADMADWIGRPSAERLKDGISVVIAGPPNAGKSTLFNALLQRDAAITSPQPGTTRDMIEASIALGGVAFRLCDTAGLRDAGHDKIEAIGIERAATAIARADMLLWLGTPDTAPNHPSCIRLAAQADILFDDSAWQSNADQCDLAISAHTGLGIADLISLILHRAAAIVPTDGEGAIDARHRMHITDAVAALDGEVGDDAADVLLLAERMRIARHALDCITGAAGTEAMFDALFGKFCIGK